MSLAGKKPFHLLRSLFRKEQAPSLLLSPYQEELVASALETFKKDKLYCYPDATISEVAARLHIDSKYIYRYCAAQGFDFRTWRTGLRIEEAKRLLLIYPDEPISHIGRRVGFADRSNFGKQFRAITGETPQIWRKNQK